MLSSSALWTVGRPVRELTRLRKYAFCRLDERVPSMDDSKPSNAAQLASPSYRLAAMDQDFLLGDSMRGVRFLLEYSKADQALRTWGVRSTIVVFGSARVREDGPGRQPSWYA